MPGAYDTAQICRNGHVITEVAEDFPQFRKDFCSRCGAATIMACESCDTPIRGDLRDSGVAIFGGPGPRAPRFCHGCGAPYPWTTQALSAARELLEEDTQLTDEEREQLDKSLDDLIRDSPQTELAARQFKRLAAKAGSETATGLKAILVSVVTEAAKRAIW